MLFDDQFVSTLDEDSIAKALIICEKTLEALSNGPGWINEDYEVLLEAFILIQEMGEAGFLGITGSSPGLKGEVASDCTEMRSFLLEVKDSCEVLSKQDFAEKTRARLRLAMGRVFAYEFTQGDLSRVQELLNELRVQIGNADFLGEEHRQRLLARLEKLQSEVHKKVSNLDRFWGIAGDASIALRKFGESAKPIVDRVRELSEIVWRTQAHAEGLPSGATMPSLGHGSEPSSTGSSDAPAPPTSEA